jgi:two-component system, OmpR family, sensor kinase
MTTTTTVAAMMVATMTATTHEVVMPIRHDAEAPTASPRRLGTAIRLVSLHAIMLLVILSAVVVSLVRTFAGQSNAATTRQLSAEINDYRTAANSRPADQTMLAFSRLYLRTHALPEGQVVVIDFPDQALLASAEAAGFVDSSDAAALWRQIPPVGVARTVNVGDTTYRTLAVPIDAGSKRAVFVVGANQREVAANEARVQRLAAIEALIALLAGSIAGFLVLRGLLRRIGRITQTAAELGQGEYDRRLGDQGTDDEVGQLAATFDAMADRVAAAMTAQRRLLSDVSHQLRTPLTVARGHLEVLDRTGVADPREVHETLYVVIDEIDQMTSLVERLLLLGRAFEPDFVGAEAIDARSFMADLHAAAAVIAPRDWSLGPVADVTLEGGYDALRGAMLNLIDNAVKATSEGDAIRVSADRLVDGEVALSVADAGPGIPPTERKDVLERFRRGGAPDATGSGLGLAIVTAVAHAHGGRVEIATSDLGGAAVSIVLPRSAVRRTGL